MATPFAINSTVQLHTGNFLPRLGFGVSKSPPHLCAQSCLSAFYNGYRHIDTAQVYGNEEQVGQAIQQSGLKREELFVTSKIFEPGDNVESTSEKILASVVKIDGNEGYLDLMLIHTPDHGPEVIKTIWQAMEELHRSGKLRAIGVSNFSARDIERMREYARIWPPAVNQLELHPWIQQPGVVSYCRTHGIILQAYCPLVRNRKANDNILVAIADKYGKSTAQVLIRYSLQKGWVPLPKSDNVERIAENANVYDFALDSNDMAQLNAQDDKNEPPVIRLAGHN